MSGAATLDELVGRGRELLRRSRGILILTGAGISADSGLATFRDPGGHWRKHRPEDLATPEAFARDPRLVWEWYGARRQAAGEAEPNAAHLAMAEIALRRGDVVIVTQNVDGLHTLAARRVAESGADDSGRLEDAAGSTRAGAKAPARKAGADRGSSRDRGRLDFAQVLPLELHGSFFRVRCTECGRRVEHRESIDASTEATLPYCPECDGLQRPDVVWFGESLGEAIERAFGCAAQAELCMVVGTSAVVQPAASVAMVTRRAGGVIIEVNPEETPLTSMSAVSIRAGAAEVVPRLLSD